MRNPSFCKLNLKCIIHGFVLPSTAVVRVWGLLVQIISFSFESVIFISRRTNTSLSSFTVYDLHWFPPCATEARNVWSWTSCRTKFRCDVSSSNAVLRCLNVFAYTILSYLCAALQNTSRRNSTLKWSILSVKWSRICPFHVPVLERWYLPSTIIPFGLDSITVYLRISFPSHFTLERCFALSEKV